MAKCAHCRKRKAKRACPALGSSLCALCCGQMRDKELHCPASCPYLVPHRSYQEKKVIQKKREFSADALNDERLAWLILNIEAAVHGFGEGHPAFMDKDAILALEYAKNRLAKGRSLILTANDDRRVMNEAGEDVLRILDQCRFQRKIILPQAMESYTADEKIRCLDNVILTVQQVGGGRVDKRSYLQDLGHRLARLRGPSSPNKIVTST